MTKSDKGPYNECHLNIATVQIGPRHGSYYDHPTSIAVAPHWWFGGVTFEELRVPYYLCHQHRKEWEACITIIFEAYQNLRENQYGDEGCYTNTVIIRNEHWILRTCAVSVGFW